MTKEAASSLVIITVVHLLVGRTQAYLTVPLPAFAHGLTTYDITGSNRVSANNDVLRRLDSDEDLEITNQDDDDQGSVYVIYDSQSEEEEEEDDDDDGTSASSTENPANIHNPLDPWSIVWYIGSFGGLVAFFLVVSCSEWCCRRGASPLSIPYSQPGEIVSSPAPCVPETPPPPYHLFAPPPYDSIYYGDITDKTSGEKLDIFVIAVPVHNAARQTSA